MSGQKMKIVRWRPNRSLYRQRKAIASLRVGATIVERDRDKNTQKTTGESVDLAPSWDNASAAAHDMRVPKRPVDEMHDCSSPIDA